MNYDGIKLISFDLGNTLIASDGIELNELSSIIGAYSYEEIVLYIMEFLYTSKIDVQTATDNFCKKFNCYEYFSKISLILNPETNNEYIYDDSFEILQFLAEYKRKNNIVIAACSNAFYWSNKSVFDDNLSHFFDYVFYSFELGSYKPKIDFFSDIEKTTGIASKQILHVGDSVYADIYGSIKCGWNSILIDRHNHYSYKNKIGSLLELRKIIQERNHG